MELQFKNFVQLNDHERGQQVRSRRRAPALASLGVVLTVERSSSETDLSFLDRIYATTTTMTLAKTRRGSKRRFNGND